ncbi:hypothetical protein DRO69_09655 [Candidatus Bathyarchaeota archaeon]|nr:MAG: hypothetical protein DRO69_09655 [Candidatus Bathyarchaeota archaeon]
MSWRLLGTVELALIAWAFTGDLPQTSAITITFNGLQIFFYYFHERLWENIEWGRKKLKK